MATQKRVLFLQLPQLDNDVRHDGENILLAAAYLQHSARQAGEDRHYDFVSLPESLNLQNNQSLLEAILDIEPAIVACSLYLWNIERTLRLLHALRTRLPGAKVLLGGPEVDYAHPFLFNPMCADAIVVGEGEVVFPELLKHFRIGKKINYSTVALRTPSGYEWGKMSPAPVSLSRQLPPPGYGACSPDSHGMAYLESSRGCPMRCTYCRYPHLRRTMSFLEAPDVVQRVQKLQRMGAKEIRFVDPTFNSHPQFREIIRQLAVLNEKGPLSFFAELDAGRITENDARLLAMAKFKDIEVGVQSRDPLVLKTVQRPTSLERLDQGLRHLINHRIKVTVDIMYGLPLQSERDVRRAIQWALQLPRANVQCLQTLLLPGTDLRTNHSRWHMKALSRPPYAVLSTSTMDSQAFQNVESKLASSPRLRSDVPTPCFVGKRLELFRQKVTVSTKADESCNCRRAYLFRGPNLFGRRQEIALFIKRTIKKEPDSLFQFVLCPVCEEPLDLLDDLVAVIRDQPSHLVDRYSSVAVRKKIASRRLMIQLPAKRKLSKGWIRAAEDILSSAFF